MRTALQKNGPEVGQKNTGSVQNLWINWTGPQKIHTGLDTTTTHACSSVVTGDKKFLYFTSDMAVHLFQKTNSKVNEKLKKYFEAKY
jgi:hypothetical protein